MDIMIVVTPRVNDLVRLLGFVLGRSGKLLGIVIFMHPGADTMLASATAGMRRFAISFVYPIDSFFSTMLVSAESMKAKMAAAQIWEHTRELLLQSHRSRKELADS